MRAPLPPYLRRRKEAENEHSRSTPTGDGWAVFAPDASKASGQSPYAVVPRARTAKLWLTRVWRNARTRGENGRIQRRTPSSLVNDPVEAGHYTEGRVDRPSVRYSAFFSGKGQRRLCSARTGRRAAISAGRPDGTSRDEGVRSGPTNRRYAFALDKSGRGIFTRSKPLSRDASPFLRDKIRFCRWYSSERKSNTIDMRILVMV